ncbi:MAG TPA: hemerythrin domain-containing protein [Nocardioides sp.]|nr:hemerythrin domain-containing protein [Nocardioides sp.]
MKSLADQTETELGGRWSILSRQKRDHVHLDRLLEQLQVTHGDAQDAVMNRVCRLVFPHAFAEESVLWPELRRRLPDGEALTLQVEQEHQEVNELVTSLEDRHRGPGGHEKLIERLITVLREDVRDEEDVLLPRLQAAVDVRRLRQLGVTWEAVRRTAPTRPHPVVSRRPPGNALAALPLTILDRSRDAMDATARRVPVLRSAMTTGSQGAAVLAGRVEHIGLLRRGEDASTRRA